MNIEKFVRPNILKVKPYTSARSAYMEGVLMDANENPLGSIVDFDGEELNRYPDPNQTELRNTLSKFINIPMQNLFFGVGSDEIIDLLIKIFCTPAVDSAIICEPTYGMYKVSCQINDVNIIELELDKNFDIDVDLINANITEKTKLLFLCSPNNPTGNLLNKEKIISIAKKQNIIIVIDEAYIDFANDEGFSKFVETYPNIIVLRTFSKAWGLAGVRCGYCVASSFIIDLLMKIKAPYSINKLTAWVILKALNENQKYYEFIKELVNEREYLIKELKNTNNVLNILSSQANYILFKVTDSNKVFDNLINKNIIIRDRSNQINLEGYLRVSVGTKEQNRTFIKTLRGII
ncbi:MAG: histidinol-phosphate transaminase [bacterium]